ncbi:hypothetical protein ECTPHS_02411 [Ectothiorhodospira sp. PHS-1]|uniref:NYN domain-containing protein n=1 Tax=Ectothiorhodospira sp. PHS-1 TaxID=519989 RepID=UPI00024A822B|nr:NYN domain-containing protein [Ectothiorhodospira sp. PHS-1]EHQ51514.1 hypothetical protein ECTPHS_02411 [Ectothiorhodospira sp. PHS-1]
MRRLALYVDGFNFYHAVSDLRRPELKWVNLARLAAELAKPTERVASVVYFSAYATWLPDAYARHREYTKALKASGVEVVMAHFKEKTVQCFKCQSTWTSREEKETDVHLALRFLADAEDDVFDRGLLLTADSDLVPVVRMVKQRHPRKNITVAAPPKRHRNGRNLQQVADSYFQVGTTKLEAALFPEFVSDGKGNVVARRPPEYDPPAVP